MQRSLDCNDIEGGWFALHAAQRYAVFGMNQTELSNRAYILREEALKMSSWRAEALENLLAVSDDQLTAECVADAMALRNEDSTNQYYKTRVTGDQLRILLMVCGAAALATMPFMFLTGRTPMVAAVLFFGLLGAAFCAVQSLIRGRNESRIPNTFVTLTPVIFGAIASLAGYAIYEYMFFYLHLTPAKNIPAPCWPLPSCLAVWGRDYWRTWPLVANARAPGHDPRNLVQSFGDPFGNPLYFIC